MNKSESILTEKDILIIKEVILENGGNWDNDRLKEIKAKIKEYHRVFIRNRCCYCARIFNGEFKMVIDIEHILPKGKFPIYEFTPVNLSIACKRCNMQIKKQDITFLDNLDETKKEPFISERYLFIHPNLDIYKEHLNYIVQIYDDNILIKYTPIHDKPKGRFTYSYFKLDELEMNQIDQAQGIKDIEISPLMKQKDSESLQELLRG
jgi:hypothetical protein